MSVPSTYCEGCHLAVIPKAYRSHTPVRNTYDPGEVVAFDTIPNPCKYPLLKETNYPVLLFGVDLCTRRCDVIGIKSKHTKQIIDGITAYEQRMGFNIQCIHSDAGDEFFSVEMLQFLRQRTAHGMPTRRNHAAPDTQWQNGIAERNWAHIKQLAHKMLTYARLPLSFAYFAIETACYTHARLPHKALLHASGRTMTPYERHKGHKPNIQHMRVFGCPVMYRMHKTAKWDQQGRRGVYVGPARDSAGYTIYNPMYRVTAISNDVIFDENFVSATSRTVPVRNKDGDLLRNFPLYTSPLTRQQHMDWTGALRDLYGSSSQQTFSDGHTTETNSESQENDSQNLNNSSDPSEILDSQDSLESTQINPPQEFSNNIALLSVFFEGGVESISKMPTKDNKQKLMIYKSETNTEENMLKIQKEPLTIEIIEQDNFKNNCNYCKQKQPKHLSQDSLDDE